MGFQDFLRNVFFSHAATASLRCCQFLHPAFRSFILSQNIPNIKMFLCMASLLPPRADLESFVFSTGTNVSRKRKNCWRYATNFLHPTPEEPVRTHKIRQRRRKAVDIGVKSQ